MTEFAVMADGYSSSHLRATYSFELGTWKATCRACGWQVSDPNRRRAVSRYRLHHKDLAGALRGKSPGIAGELPEENPAPVLVDGRG